MKPLTRLTLTLTIAFTLLTCAAAILGQILPPSPMLAYLSFHDTEVNIQVMESRTHQAIDLGTISEFTEGSFGWSADGRLAFSSHRNGNQEIYVWDGISLTNISQSVAYDASPAWSTDGQLAFVSERDGNKEIYVWGGTSLSNISQHPADDYMPTWSADGRLAFTSEQNGNYDVYLWDGASLTNLTRTPNEIESPLAWWSP